MNSALILDGHLTKSALACVRSLGKQGITISCGSTRSTAPACHSRYASRSFIYASPNIDQDKFIEDIIEEAKQLSLQDQQKPVLFCFSDATSLSIARAQEVLKEYVLLGLPAIEAIETASDKRATYALASQLSVPIITTYNENEFADVAYPSVVKNRHSIVWKDGKSISGSAQFVFSHDELSLAYKRISDMTGENPLVQKFVKGDEYGVEMVCENGEPLATFVHKRIRSLSPRGGAAVVKETAKETEEVELMCKYALSLVKELKWQGPVMVEFKIDANDGRVLLMEINGRFWGSLPLAVKAGVDFPMMQYHLARGEQVENLKHLKPIHLRTRHFLGDCKWIFAVLFADDPLRKELYPSRLRAFYDFKKEIFISKGDVFVWNDLMPSIMEYIDIIRKRIWK